VTGAWNLRGYVLAGGASLRFGSDKALVELQGKSMLARTAGLLAKVCGSVAIVAQKNKLEDSSTETIADRWPGEGPLGGILTALLDSEATSGSQGWNLILSCDMPFLTEQWLTFLAERAERSEAEAVVPKSDHGWEPLCVCWKNSVTPPISAAFDAGTRKVTEALKQLHVEVLDEKDWKRFDTNGRLFWNMNTAADYQEALRVFSSGNS
jgi:molybdenum cofactor guanylyltransferase